MSALEAEGRAIIREIVDIDDEWKTVRGHEAPVDLFERQRALKDRARRWLQGAEAADANPT